jgi:hypothetical protein
MATQRITSSVERLLSCSSERGITRSRSEPASFKDLNIPQRKEQSESMKPEEKLEQVVEECTGHVEASIEATNNDSLVINVSPYRRTRLMRLPSRSAPIQAEKPAIINDITEYAPSIAQFVGSNEPMLPSTGSPTALSRILLHPFELQNKSARINTEINPRCTTNIPKEQSSRANSRCDKLRASELPRLSPQSFYSWLGCNQSSESNQVPAESAENKLG